MHYSTEIEANLYRQVFETSHDAILILDNEQRVIDCNEKTLSMFMATREQLKTTPPRTLSPRLQPDGSLSSEKSKELLAKAFAGKTQFFEWQHLRTDGQLFDAQVTLQLIQAGELQFVQAVVRDITLYKQNEKLIRENEVKLQTLADNAPVMLKMTNANNLYDFFSSQWLKFTGSTAAQEQNSGWVNHIHPDDYALVLSTLDMAFKKRIKFEVQYRLRQHNGEYRTIFDSGVPYSNDKGEFQGYIASAIDITERTFAEESKSRKEAAAATETRLYKSFEKAHLLALTLDKKGLVVKCNPFFEKVTGWTSAEIIGQNWKKFWDTSSTNETPDINLSDADEVLSSIEKSILTKDGGIRLVRFNVMFLNSTRSDAANYILIGEDITEKRRVRLKLAESNEQLQDILDNANDLIMLFGLDGKLQFVNNAWKQTLGYNDEEIKDLTIDNLLHPQHKSKTKEHLKVLLQHKGSEKFETAFKTKSGKKVYLSASMNCKISDNEPIGFRAILYDVTEKIRAEKAQKLYYIIANLISNSNDLQVLYESIYEELNNIIDAHNFFIALNEPDGKHINFVYYLDENTGGRTNVGLRPKAKGLVEHTILQQKPIFLTEQDIQALVSQGDAVVYGSFPKLWIGVPLKINNAVTGIIAVMSFDSPLAYDHKDLELLDFISGQIALAIQRKQDEDKINKQTARLNAIFESSSHLMWSVNKHFTLTSSNKNYQQIATRNNFLPPITPTSVFDARIALPHQQNDLYLRYEAAFRGEAQHFEIQDYNEKNTHWFEIFLNPIYWNENHIAEVSGIAHDITEKKNTEIAIQENEEMFRNIFESFQDIYFRTDAEGNFLMVSPSIKELCGYTPDQIIGKNIKAFYIYNVRRKQTIRELYRKGRIRNFEVPIITANGDVLNFISNIRLLRDKNGKLTGAEGVARDITELKQASEATEAARAIAERSLKVKEKFLANMSHEIRTPMNGVIGVIDLLADTDLQPKQMEYVQTIKKSSETLLTILNDILDISKIEAGKMKLRQTNFSLTNTMDKLFSLYRHNAEEKGLKLGYTVAPDVPMFLCADETRLIQILSNLTSNALKFTDKGGVHIRISVATRLRNGKFLIRVEVKDTGIGISEQNMQMLFGYFEQVDTSSTKSYGGTGLGLAISKQLSSMMKGDIGVYSTEGEGSTFWFTFQAKAAEPETFVQAQEESRVVKSVFTKYQPYLLLVDDNLINQKVAYEILRRAGCIVDVAANGLEAIDKVKQNNYSIVLMDIQMPQMDGVTATQHIRELKLPQTPTIIAMTAYSMQDDREKFISAGMDDYISKPITAEKLTNTIKVWIDKKHKDKSLPNPPPLHITEGDTPLSEHVYLVVNTEVLEQLRKHIGSDLLKETLKEFEIESQQLIEVCGQALLENNDKAALAALHTLKGNASTLGIDKLADRTRTLESSLRQGNKQNLATEINWLSEAFSEFSASYTQILQI